MFTRRGRIAGGRHEIAGSRNRDSTHDADHGARAPGAGLAAGGAIRAGVGRAPAPRPAGREGLFRVHRTHPALYARARRLFGSWEGAVRACGLDYGQIVHRAFERAAQTRRRAQRRTFVTLP